MVKKINYEDDDILAVINGSKSAEYNLEAVWKRNVFFILAYGLLYVYFLIHSILNRCYKGLKYVFCKLKKIPYTYIRKPARFNWINIHNRIIDSNIWRTMWYAIVFTSFGIGKLVYHAALIFGFLWKHLIIPFIKWITILFAITSISGAISSRNQNRYN